MFSGAISQYSCTGISGAILLCFSW